MENSLEKAYFAGGCFWGVEHYFQIEPGVISTQVGFMGGDLSNPTYEDVCYKKTGHAEVVEVVFDKTKVSFEKIAKLFFEIHDPTQIDRQGPDVGDQYRSEIFYTTEDQKNISQKLIDVLKSKDYQVVTRLTKTTDFWPAEEYHQKYYQKNGKQPYCHFREVKFD
jgi:peptide methionine sulfoxide reductase msrA/msrB